MTLGLPAKEKYGVIEFILFRATDLVKKATDLSGC